MLVGSTWLFSIELDIEQGREREREGEREREREREREIATETRMVQDFQKLDVSMLEFV
jgi:hypothetical protein